MDQESRGSVDGVSVLGKKCDALYNALKFLKRADKKIRAPVCFPLHLKFFLICVLFAVFVFQLYRDRASGDQG